LFDAPVQELESRLSVVGTVDFRSEVRRIADICKHVRSDPNDPRAEVKFDE